jgi:hypothetical protein
MYIGQQISSWEIHQLCSKGRKSLKALYAPSVDKQRQMDAIFDFYVEHSPHVEYAVTLQTKLVVKRERDLSEKQRISLEDDFRIFAKRLQRDVYGMAHRRKPQKFSLMLLPTIEGSLFSPEGLRTLHYHVGIGNVPADMDMNKLRKSIFEHWAKTAYGQMDINIKPGNEGWISYITKEVEQGNTRCCDWQNAYVPGIALYP